MNDHPGSCKAWQFDNTTILNTTSLVEDVWSERGNSSLWCVGSGKRVETRGDHERTASVVNPAYRIPLTPTNLTPASTRDLLQNFSTARDFEWYVWQMILPTCLSVVNALLEMKGAASLLIESPQFVTTSICISNMISFSTLQATRTQIPTPIHAHSSP